jgi:copper resistance protein C
MIKRLLAAVSLAAATLLAVAPVASAHTKLIGSNPASGAQVADAPHELTLTFNEPVRPEIAQVTVAGPGGLQWTVGQISAKDNALLVPVHPAGPAGPYTISYRIGSADDHPVTGTVAFTLASPVPVSTTQPPTSTTTPTTTSATSAAPTSSAAVTTQAQTGDSGGMPAWVWILAAVVLVGAGITVVLVRRRSRPGPAGTD